MYIQKRKDKSGKEYYSFSYTSGDGKRIRLKKSEHPYFEIREEAESWAKSQDAYRASQKARIDRKLSWKSRYYEFEDLLEKYRMWQQPKAPNSFMMNCYYLEHFAFPFYLEIKKSSNVNDWYLLHQEFKDWLSSGAESVKRKRKAGIAVATRNNVIKTVNTFMEFLSSYNLVDPDNMKKMKAFDSHLTNHRDVSDVITDEEHARLVVKLDALNPEVSHFYQVLYGTGMRFSELFSLSFKSLHGGQVSDTAFHDELTRYGINYKGYILLENQASRDDRIREADGSIKRKPLKGRKTMTMRDARVIPIADVKIWNILVARYKACKLEFEARKWTNEAADYCLFDGLEYNVSQRTLRAPMVHCRTSSRRHITALGTRFVQTS